MSHAGRHSFVSVSFFPIFFSNAFAHLFLLGFHQFGGRVELGLQMGDPGPARLLRIHHNLSRQPTLLQASPQSRQLQQLVRQLLLQLLTLRQQVLTGQRSGQVGGHRVSANVVRRERGAATHRAATTKRQYHRRTGRQAYRKEQKPPVQLQTNLSNLPRGAAPHTPSADLSIQRPSETHH